jgi:hypothetical protein
LQNYVGPIRIQFSYAWSNVGLTHAAATGATGFAAAGKFATGHDNNFSPAIGIIADPIFSLLKCLLNASCRFCQVYVTRQEPIKYIAKLSIFSRNY